MIVSDQHKFAFVHIPKCAGTSVRKALRPIDETIGKFDQIAHHPEMGMIHYGHITLPDLEAHFPDYYAKLCRFRSVAIVRDPQDRFFSAVFQRLREFKGYQQSQITSSVVDSEARALVVHLEATTERLDLQHVHFNRQSDYVWNDNVRVVGRVFALHRLHDAAKYIEECTGVQLIAEDRENRTAELRFSALKPLAKTLRGPYAALVPLALRDRVRARLTRAGLYGDVEKSQFAKSGSYLSGFLKDYYQQDFELFAAARAA